MKTSILSERHLEDLRSSGLSEATIQAAGLYSADSQEARRLGFGTAGPGLVFPYPSPNGEQPFFRLKPDASKTDKNGRLVKYLTVKGAGNRLYIPSILPANELADPQVALILTEGEKKALKANQEHFPCIGLAGVWCWLMKDGGQSLPLEDFNRIAWKGRLVYICFDSDIAGKPEVERAERRLAQELKQRGATVVPVRLPGDTGGANNG